MVVVVWWWCGGGGLVVVLCGSVPVTPYTTKVCNKRSF